MGWLAWWRPPCLLRAVIVNLKDDSGAIRGVLWAARGAWLVLREPALLKAGAEPEPIDGDVVLHRSNVSFMQVLP